MSVSQGWPSVSATLTTTIRTILRTTRDTRTRTQGTYTGIQDTGIQDTYIRDTDTLGTVDRDTDGTVEIVFTTDTDTTGVAGDMFEITTDMLAGAVGTGTGSRRSHRAAKGRAVATLPRLV